MSHWESSRWGARGAVILAMFIAVGAAFGCTPDRPIGGEDGSGLSDTTDGGDDTDPADTTDDRDDTGQPDIARDGADSTDTAGRDAVEGDTAASDADAPECTDPSDCASNVCREGTCVPASCDDQTRNGKETGTDCGGPDCPACSVGDACSGDSDCKSGICDGSTCQTCRSGQTRTTKSCGYKDRGTLQEVCKNGTWKKRSSQSCTDVWFADCEEHLDAKPNASNGVYEIDPDGPGGADAFPVFCEMSASGGGWTRLYLRSDGPSGATGVGFGSNKNGYGRTRWTREADYNWSQGVGYFQKPGNNQCTAFAIGRATTSTYQGKTTLWDYYDSDGNALTPAQVDALAKTVDDRTVYNGKYWVSDPDAPFPDGGDGPGGTNGFNIKIDPNATHIPGHKGPLVLWFSTDPNMDNGTTHAIGSDYGDRVNRAFQVSWKTIHDGGLPKFMGAKVDRDENLYSSFQNGCDPEDNGILEFKQPYFYAR